MKPILLKCVLYLLILYSYPLKPVVILVHGTYSSNARWHQPNGDFFKIIEKEAEVLGHKVANLKWSGANNNKARFIAAESLAKLILSYPIDEEKIVIGHSHGGNVIAIASALLYDPVAKLEKSGFSPKHVDSLLKDLLPKINNELNNTEKSIYRGVPEDSEQLDCVKCWIQSCKNIHEEIKKVKEHNIYRTNLVEEYLINKAYFLATPVDQTIYLPNMNVIKNVFHFYSLGDLIQPVLGLYRRNYEGINRINNFKICFQLKGHLINPSHTQMRDILIAKWILMIPERLYHDKIGGFENFDLKLDGEIHFHKDKIKYIPNPSTKEKIEQQAMPLKVNLPAGNSISLEIA